MPEEFDEQAQEPINWERYLGAVRRRSWHFLIPFFAGWLIVWAASWMLPTTYRSGTLILVEEPSVPASLVPSNISGDLQSRLDSITQQILSRTRLLHIISQYNLYASEAAHASPDQLVQRMRKDIDIELVRSPDARKLTAFNVYYSYKDPHIAQQVTSELTNLFISQNLEARQQQATNTTKFLEDQLKQASQSLAQQEDKVRKFQDQHLGDLPGQLQGNLQILTGLQAQLQNQQTALNSAKEHNVYLESLLSQYKNLQQSAGVTTSTGSPTGGLPAIDQELSRLRAQLADLSARYTDQYPDVKKVREQIAKTEQMKQKIQAQLQNSAHDAGDGMSTATGSAAQDSAPMLEIKSQLKANEIEIANREHSVASLQAQITQYQARLNDAPLREQQLTELTRGYDQSKADYDSLLKKKNESELATNLEYQQQGEHFSILDPPDLPTRPHSPNRIKLFAMALFMGFALGGVVAFGTEYMDSRLYTEAELKKVVPVDVIAEIPAIITPEEQKIAMRGIWLRIAAAGAVAFSLLLAFSFTLLRG